MWQKIGRTEVIMDNLNPQWVTSFDVQYQFEKREAYRVDVYDVNDYEKVENLPAHDTVGSLEFSLHEVVTARNATLIKNLEYENRAEGASGMIKITADEHAGTSNEAMTYKLSGRFDYPTGLIFFLVHKFIAPGVYKPVYKSEISGAKNGEFSWEKNTTLIQELCSQDPEREIRIEFFKSKKSGLNKNKGYITTNLAQIKEGNRTFFLHGRDGKPTKYEIKFDFIGFENRHSFLEYIFGGCQM